MIARYKRMRGYDVFYPFGFDDNGLPTERLVEKGQRYPGGYARKPVPGKVYGNDSGIWKRVSRVCGSVWLSVDWLIPAVSRRYPTIPAEDIPGLSGAGKAEKDLQGRIAGIMVYVPDLHRPGRLEMKSRNRF